MIIDRFRHRAPWQNRASGDPHHAARVEETLAHVRLVLFLLSLLVSVVDPRAVPGLFGTLVLGGLAAYSLAAIFVLHRYGPLAPRQLMGLHVVDTSGILLVLLLTGGALSPFSTLILFCLLAAGYRWGQLETWMTAAAGVAALGAQALLMRFAFGSDTPDLHFVTLRTTYLAIGGILVGYMAENERIQRHGAWLVSRLLRRVRADAGVVSAVQAVMDELMSQFRATHGVLVIDEDGSDRVAIWQAERSSHSSKRVSIRLSQEAKDAETVYSFPVPPAAEAFKVRLAAPGESRGEARAIGLDAHGTRLSESFSAAPLLAVPFSWQTAFCASAVAGEGWAGRLYLFLPFDPPAARAQLRYFRHVIRHIGPVLFNLYLRRRLESRAGVADRARIARELHDGVIQALIGIEMQLDVLRRQAADHVPAATLEQLANIQRLLGQQVLEVRDLMHLLKPEEVDATRLAEHLADMIERFRHRTSIRTRFVCGADDIDLTPRACREVAGIVQEALANVRKHSGATSVVVRLSRSGPNWKLVVDDNGCGLDFDGYLTPQEVEARRKGPHVIRERARAIGGSVALRSHPGSGLQLEVTIPPKHHA